MLFSPIVLAEMLRAVIKHWVSQVLLIYKKKNQAILQLALVFWSFLKLIL